MRHVRIERRPIPAGPRIAADDRHPVLQRIYASRGVCDASELEYRLGALVPPTLGGIENACEILEQAMRGGQRIVIVGDFDCDGATGTALAMRGLRLLGARNVGYGVPNRATHGYGLGPALVEELLAQRPDVLVTVDNGIAAHAGIAAAHRHGIRVVVTDHHLPGAALPDAEAIVNPNAIPDSAGAEQLHASGTSSGDPRRRPARLNNLAGVGVVFYVLLALRARLRTHGWFAECGVSDPDLSVLLDLVALGTVADLVPLDYNNRILVEAGLRRIRSGRACAGIAALLASGKRDPARAVASDLGFIVGPRVNAAGRLDDIRLGIECLLTDDATAAASMADALTAINNQRRDLQADMTAQAEAAVHKWISRLGAQALPFGVVLFEPDWHHGVVGLVASRLKDLLNRPVIACAPADFAGVEPAEAIDAGKRRGELKASGRSVEGFHLRDALAEIEALHPGLMQRFGGHAMAAGLSIDRADIDAFAAAFDEVARRHLAPEQLEAVLWTDGELDAEHFCVELARSLRHAGPWGQAFPEPLFDGEFDVTRWRVVGETHLRLDLRHAGIAAPLDAIWFGAYRGSPPPARIRAAYALETDDWSGQERLRLLLRHAESIE